MPTLTTCKDINTFRVVDTGKNYAIICPGHKIPHGWDWLIDFASFNEALSYVNDRMDSDALMATIANTQPLR
jgi:uncharacterized protein YbdZ (MbtH family)